MSATGESARHKTATVLTRISIATSIASWAALLALVCAEAAGARMLSPAGLGIATTWLVGTGALTLILPLASGADGTIISLVSNGLRLGDADLDVLLVPARRRRWRAVPAVGTALTHVAAIAWVLSLIFSIQLGDGVYHLDVETSADVLRVLMAGAVWPTVLAVSGRIEARRHAIFEIACEAHREIRGVAAPCEETLNLKRLTLLEGGERKARRRLYRSERDASAPTTAHGA